jgi:hypothetical protein
MALLKSSNTGCDGINSELFEHVALVMGSNVIPNSILGNLKKKNLSV